MSPFLSFSSVNVRFWVGMANFSATILIIGQWKVRKINKIEAVVLISASAFFLQLGRSFAVSFSQVYITRGSFTHKYKVWFSLCWCVLNYLRTQLPCEVRENFFCLASRIINTNLEWLKMITVLPESVTGTYLQVQTSLFSVLFPWVVTWAFTFWNMCPFMIRCFPLFLFHITIRIL